MFEEKKNKLEPLVTKALHKQNIEGQRRIISCVFLLALEHSGCPSPTSCQNPETPACNRGPNRCLWQTYGGYMGHVSSHPHREGIFLTSQSQTLEHSSQHAPSTDKIMTETQLGSSLLKRRIKSIPPFDNLLQQTVPDFTTV
jgi:hypothetical protein